MPPLHPPFVAIVAVLALYTLGIVMVVGALRPYFKVSRLLTLLERLLESSEAISAHHRDPQAP